MSTTKEKIRECAEWCAIILMNSIVKSGKVDLEKEVIEKERELALKKVVARKVSICKRHFMNDEVLFVLFMMCCVLMMHRY